MTSHRSVPTFARGASTDPDPSRLDAYVILEQLLKDTIVEHAIYVESDLKMLFDSAIEQNSKLDRDRMESAIEKVKTWFMQGCPVTR